MPAQPAASPPSPVPDVAHAGGDALRRPPAARCLQHPRLARVGQQEGVVVGPGACTGEKRKQGVQRSEWRGLRPRRSAEAATHSCLPLPLLLGTHRPPRRRRPGRAPRAAASARRPLRRRCCPAPAPGAAGPFPAAPGGRRWAPSSTPGGAGRAAGGGAGRAAAPAGACRRRWRRPSLPPHAPPRCQRRRRTRWRPSPRPTSRWARSAPRHACAAPGGGGVCRCGVEVWRRGWRSAAQRSAGPPSSSSAARPARACSIVM